MSENGRDASGAAPAAMVEVRRALAAAPPGRRVDVLLSQPDPAAVVQALPADEVFHLVQAVGLADSAEIVRLASPEQFRSFVDLDGWDGTEPDPERLLTWIRAARPPSAEPGSAEEWREKLAALDPELVSLLLRRTLRLHDLEADPDPEIEGDRFVRTPDERFVVEFLPEGAEYHTLRRLVDDLYAQDAGRAGQVLHAIRWELESDLAESALRWRTGRLADLGHPSMEEALSWFARPAARPAAPAGLPERPPGFWLATFRGTTLLDRAAARLPQEELERFEAEAVTAANAVMVADRVDPSDSEAVRGAVEAARALLEMGLESLSGGDEVVAARVLASTPAKRIFQEGFGRLLGLKWRAERLPREYPSAPAPDAPLGEALAALRSRRPRYFPGLDLPRDRWGDLAAAAGQPRAFRSLEEVRRAEAALADAEELAALAGRLGLAPPPAGEAPPPTLAEVYLTSLANERLGRAFEPRPLPASELPAAARALADLSDARLEREGPAGALLATLARNRAGELAPLRAGEEPPPGAVTAVLVAP